MQLSTMVTMVLGFATCVSPCLVALINNRHTRTLRKIELEANESLKKIELNAAISREFALSDRDLKYKVMFNFIDIASRYLFDYNNVDLYSKMLSARSECIAIGFQWSDLDGYMQYVKPPSENFSLDERTITQMQLFLKYFPQKFNVLLKESLATALIE